MNEIQARINKLKKSRLYRIMRHYHKLRIKLTILFYKIGITIKA